MASLLLPLLQPDIAFRDFTLNRLGSLLAHLGVAVCALGIAQVSHHSQEGGTRTKPPTKPYQLGAFEFRFEGREPVIGPNYTAERITLSVHKNGKKVAATDTGAAPLQRAHHEHERTRHRVGNVRRSLRGAG